ncbi:DUF2520 domain-containing protein [Niveibacterium sp. 24ML]|uniref:Rossmann-like and DUF2520 domain-containing protein n=1 Tax=Niveibacterium sp. 24ML TaxID=2985512 RepID=UPI00226F70B7|nr:Rossmann-like and DUF2520 domain-containing protein [Niveibacterium sp. 24ML]MCX9154941.1 DUF2520 domain-containing protein [Niveibacterium sp. 24ML]
MQASTSELKLIGAGRLGRSLARLWHNAGVLRMGDVMDTDPAATQGAINFIGAGTAAAAQRPSPITLIATHDDAIATAAATLAASGVVRNGDIVFHCSGALASEVLKPLKACGAHIASVHPMKSFATPASAVSHFSGTVCAQEGDEAALAVLGPLFDAIGGQRITIAKQHKLLYHAGAVMACNQLVALMDGALRCLLAAGVPSEAAWPALRPLIDGTLANIDRAGTRAALSGPIARGDLATVKAECAATSALDHDLGQAYVTLSALALHLTPAGHPIRRADLIADPIAHG